MATQAMACPTALAGYLPGYHCNTPWLGWVIGGLPQQFASGGFDSNPRIAIAAKVLVQSKNLLKLKDSPDQCLNDPNASHHLPLPGILLRVLRRYIVDQSLSKGVWEYTRPQVAAAHRGGKSSREEQGEE